MIFNGSYSQMIFQFFMKNCNDMTHYSANNIKLKIGIETKLNIKN